MRTMSIFHWQRRVRYFETDPFGAAHHSRALHWFEEVRTEYLRALGRPYGEWEEAGFSFPVRDVGCHYRTPARFDALLDVTIEAVEVRGASARFDYRIDSAGAVVAEGFTLHACVDREGKPTRLPAELRRLLSGSRTA